MEISSILYAFQLRELEDKYAECMEMLHEAQEELKNLRNKTMPNATSRRYHSLGLFPMVRSIIRNLFSKLSLYQHHFDYHMEGNPLFP